MIIDICLVDHAKNRINETIAGLQRVDSSIKSIENYM